MAQLGSLLVLMLGYKAKKYGGSCTGSHKCA
jgi:hypothetical protein